MGRIDGTSFGTIVGQGRSSPSLAVGTQSPCNGYLTWLWSFSNFMSIMWFCKGVLQVLHLGLLVGTGGLEKSSKNGLCCDS